METKPENTTFDYFSLIHDLRHFEMPKITCGVAKWIAKVSPNQAFVGSVNTGQQRKKV